MPRRFWTRWLKRLAFVAASVLLLAYAGLLPRYARAAQVCALRLFFFVCVLCARARCGL